MVITIELVKLCVTLFRSRGKCPILKQVALWRTLRTSSYFVVPSFLYAINNNIYFYGLTLVPPPIWIILCSFRTVVTASLYKVFIFYIVSLTNRSFYIIHPNATTKWYQFETISMHLWGYLSIAVGAALYTESLFKFRNVKDETFLGQQF